MQTTCQFVGRLMLEIKTIRTVVYLYLQNNVDMCLLACRRFDVSILGSRGSP